jgi:hypothetical protein
VAADVGDGRTGLSLCDTVCDIAPISSRGPGTNIIMISKRIAIGSMNTSSFRVLTRCLDLTISRYRISPPVGCPGNCPATRSKPNHTTTAAVQRLEVLYARRRGAGMVFVCAGGISGQITVPQAWTDRGEPPLAHRLSAECLAGLDTLMHRLPVGGGRTLSHGRP